MNYAANTKYITLQTDGFTCATDATNSGSFCADTKGFNYASVYVKKLAATAVNSSAKWLSMEIREGTTTDLTNATAVNGTIGTTNATATATQFVIPTDNETTHEEVIALHVDWRTKNRYLWLITTGAVTHNTGSAHVILSKPEIAVDSAAEANDGGALGTGAHVEAT